MTLIKINFNIETYFTIQKEHYIKILKLSFLSLLVISNLSCTKETVTVGGFKETKTKISQEEISTAKEYEKECLNFLWPIMVAGIVSEEIGKETFEKKANELGTSDISVDFLYFILKTFKNLCLDKECESYKKVLLKTKDVKDVNVCNRGIDNYLKYISSGEAYRAVALEFEEKNCHSKLLMNHKKETDIKKWVGYDWSQHTNKDLSLFLEDFKTQCLTDKKYENCQNIKNYYSLDRNSYNNSYTPCEKRIEEYLSHLKFNTKPEEKFKKLEVKKGSQE